MDINKMKVEYASLIAQAKALMGKEELTKDERTQVDTLLGKSDELKAQILMAERIAQGEAYGNEPAGTKAAHLGSRPAGPDEGMPEVDTKAWREMDVNGMKVRYHVPLAVQAKGYASAFESYMRHGKDNMGPNDRKALTEATDSAGGFLVPEDPQAGIVRKIATLATVRNFARVISTSRDLVKIKRRKYTTNNEYTAGGRMTWTGESPAAATTARVTSNVYGDIAVPVNTALATELVSFDLLEDNAYDVMGDVAQVFGEAFGLGENDTFWNGTGAGQPRGILVDAGDTTNWDAAINDTATASTLTSDELIDVYYALPSQYEIGARWFWAKSTEAAIRKLTDTNGDYMWPVWAQVGQLGASPTGLFGVPYTRDEAIPSVSDATDGSIIAVYGNLNGYTIVDRVGLSIQRFDEIYSETNNALILGRKRVGGQLAEAYKLSCYRYQTTT